MNILIQLSAKENGSEQFQCSSIRNLRIFALHKSIFNSESKTFVHYLIVIGYSGGGCQEECFFKIDSSNLEKCTVSISQNVGDYFYQLSYNNQKITKLENEMTQFDKQILDDFFEVINNNLSYNENLCYYFYSNQNSMSNSDFTISDKFPIRLLYFLNNVYWPFSTYWCNNQTNSPAKRVE
jgi:hypothetical protein